MANYTKTSPTSKEMKPVKKQTKTGRSRFSLKGYLKKPVKKQTKQKAGGGYK
tara:strand:+ start:923 stop:1078 length:156 start_codon:yes stop_codon:yes gene_type:complete